MTIEGQAERRSAMLGEAIAFSGHLTGAINPLVLSAHLIKWSGLPEEDSGGDVLATIFFLIRMGLFTSNTGDSIGSETRLTPSRLLLGHLYDEH